MPTSRSTTARRRRRRRHATCSSTRTAPPIRANRATRRWRSACPARWRGSRWRMHAMARANSRLADLIAPAIRLARDGMPVEDDVADSLPGAAAPPGPLAVGRKDLPQSRRARARPRRPAGAERSRRHARSDRARRSARLLPRRRRRKAGGRGARRRRHPERRRLEKLPAARARAGARALSRLRHRLHAAVILRRGGADRDAQHPGRISGTASSPATARSARISWPRR